MATKKCPTHTPEIFPCFHSVAISFRRVCKSVPFCKELSLELRKGSPGSRRVRLPKNLHTCWTPWAVFRNSNDGKSTKTRFFACHCLGAWDWWSGCGPTKFEESFSTQLDGHSAELAGATKNSVGKRRTIGYRKRHDVQLEQTVAVGSCTTRRQEIAQTADMDVTDPPRGLRLPPKAQRIREPFQFRLRS